MPFDKLPGVGATVQSFENENSGLSASCLVEICPKGRGGRLQMVADAIACFKTFCKCISGSLE